MARSFLKIVCTFLACFCTTIFCMTFRSARFVRTGYAHDIFTVTNKINSVPYQLLSLMECAKMCSSQAGFCVRFEFYKQREDYLGECVLFKSGGMCLNNGSLNLAYRDCYRLEYKKYEDDHCKCAVGVFGNGDQCCKHVIEDCSDSQGHPHLANKGDMISYIKPNTYSKPFEVQCHFGFGGLTYIQVRRTEGKVVDFNRTWEEYKQGFGSLQSTYWLGLDKTLAILNNGGSYQLDMTESCTVYISNFRMKSELDDYAIEFDSVSQYNCNGNFFRQTSFSTYDHDTTGTNNNCSLRMKSGWWFDASPTCNMINVNTPYYTAFTALQLKRT